jgi:hypothetical protein
LFKNDWSFRTESEVYLRNDLLGLYQVLRKENLRVKVEDGIKITDDTKSSDTTSTVYDKLSWNNTSIDDSGVNRINESRPVLLIENNYKK